MTTSDWIEWTWTEEKPFPNYEGVAYIREKDGWESENAGTAMGWDWYTVTHYRLA